MSQPPELVNRAERDALRRRVLRITLGVLVSILTIYLALRDVDLAQVEQALLAADARWVGLALLGVAVNVLAKAYRWRLMMPGYSFGRLLLALLAGAMLNYYVPARLGDFSRAYAAGSPGAGRAFALGTVLLEKVFDLVAYALLFIILVLLIPLPEWASQPGLVFVLAALAGVGAAGLVAYRRGYLLAQSERWLSRLPQSWQVFTHSRLKAGLDSLDTLQGTRALLGLSFWSAVIWLAALATNQFMLQALDLDLPWTASLLVLVVLQVGITIPSVPGRIGVFEYLCILALGIFGVDHAPALTYGILLHGVVLIPTTLAGLLAIWLLGIGGHWAVDAPSGERTS